MIIFVNWVHGIFQEERLNLSPFTSLEEVEDYSEKTHGSLNYLLLECLGEILDLNVFCIITANCLVAESVLVKMYE